MASRIHLAGLLGAHEQRSAQAVEADILAELRSHLELATSDNIAAGMDPDRARRSAEERFGDFEGVFGACRTEKLKDRIMLQRVLLVLVLILTIAVIGQADQARESQRASALAMDAMRREVSAMTHRIEERFDTALFLGSRERAQNDNGRSDLDSSEMPTRELDLRRTRYANQLAELLLRKTTLKPAHPYWTSIQKEIEDLEEQLRMLEPPAHQTQPLTRDRNEPSAEPLLEVLRLTANIEYSTDAGQRFEMVHRLLEIALAWDGHAEKPLARGDLVLARDSLQPSLSFGEKVNDEGNLAVPELGFVAVLGLTRGELEARLQRELETYFAEVDLQVSKEAWAFDVLIESLRDSDVFVRLAAAQALGEIGDPRARRALERAAEQDTEGAVREAAASAASNCQ